MIPPIGLFLNVNGARIHYVDRGDGPPLVMIHGLAGVLQNFTHSLAARLEPRYRAIAIDRPGAGYSQRLPGESASLMHQAETIARALDQLGVRRPLVVGHSLGGAIALALAIARPEYVRGLALIAPLTQPMQRPPTAFRPLFIRSPLARALFAYTVAVPFAKLHARETVLAIFAPEPVPPDFGTAGGALLGLRASQFYHAASDLVAAHDDLPAIMERYGEVRATVRVLYGDRDAILDYRVHGERLRTRIAQTQLTVVEGAGHMLPVTQPARVAEWLRACDVAFP